MQSGKTTALYYRVASKDTDTLYLDNQMHTLLCYANEQGLNSFMLYADIGVSGLTLNRPALNALKLDIEAGRVGKVAILNISRLARNHILVGNFIEWARKYGAEVISATDDLPDSDMCAVIRALLKGGGRV